MEHILKIEEYTEVEPCGSMSGYIITTNKQVIKLLMDDTQQCCEDFGYFMSEDDLSEFVGAELLGIKIIDTELKEALLKQHGLNNTRFEGGIMFVDIITSKGTLQFVAYNYHNGYYGHYATVISEQLNYEEWL